MNRNEIEEIVFGVQPDQVCGILDRAEEEGDSVADEHAFQHDRRGYAQENSGDGAVGHAHGFQDSDGRDVAEQHNQQRRYHVEARHHCHQYQDKQHVEVDKVQPGEDFRVFVECR